MYKLLKWGLLSLLLALVLAGCGQARATAAPTTAVAPTPTTPPTAPEPTATPTPTPTAVAPTPTPVEPTATTVGPRPTVVDQAQLEILSWQREGGIAGFCDSVTVFGDGGFRAASCQSQEAQTGRLSGVETDRLLAWVARLAPVEHVQSDGAVADSMTVRLNLAGQGTQAASEADLEAMLEFATSLLPPPAQVPAHAVVQAGVRYVLANEDVPMRAGPGAEHAQIGQLAGGQVAWVTGASADGAWWRVICPDETVGDCWLTAEHELVLPATPPGAWPVYAFPIGLSVDYPAGWSFTPDLYDEARYSAWFHVPEMDSLPVGVEVYRRPVSERDTADPYTWQPNQGGYEVHWSRPITSVQGLVGLEFVWGAYSEPQKAWNTPPQWMAVYYSPEHELDVRLSVIFEPPALDTLATSGMTETVAAHFGLPRRMAQSVRLHSTAGWDLYRDTEADGLFELKHPPGWAVQAERVGCALHYKLDSLTLLVFEGCPARAGGEALTFFDTLQRFREGLGGPPAVSRRAVDGLQVEVTHYAAASETGIMALDPGPGTVALWTMGEQGFALVDENNRYQADGTFDGVLGTFRLLPPMPRLRPRPLEGRAVEGRPAFDLPGVGTTIVLPAGYGVLTNNEYNRRGSLVSFDVTPYGGPTPRLGEIQFFSEVSLRTFHKRCDAAAGGFCFEGDYPDLARFQTFQAAMDACTAPAPYEARQFGGRCYLVGNHRCTGDICVLREYTTFLEGRMVSMIVVQQDSSQTDASDALLGSLELVSRSAP